MIGMNIWGMRSVETTEQDLGKFCFELCGITAFVIEHYFLRSYKPPHQYTHTYHQQIKKKTNSKGLKKINFCYWIRFILTAFEFGHS